MEHPHAIDAAAGSGMGRIRTFRTRDLAELARVGEAAWRRIEQGEPAYALRLTRAALYDGVLDVQREAPWGRNTWVDGWHDAVLDAWRLGTPLQITHLEIGTTSGAVPARTDTAVAGALAPRKAITDIVRDGHEYLRTSTFLSGSDYAGQTLRTGGLWTSITGGILVNHLNWTASLTKIATESAIADIDLRLVPV